MVRRSLWAAALSAAFVFALALPGTALGFGPLSSFGSWGTGAGQLKSGGLAIGPNGDHYVVDYGNRRIDQFGPDGAFIRAFGKEVDPAGGDVCTASTGCQLGAETSGAGSFVEVEDIAINGQGQLFLADWGNHRIDVYSAEGVFERAFGVGVSNGGDEMQTCTTSCEAGLEGAAPGMLEAAYGIAIDPASGDLYVSDYYLARVSVFTQAGAFVEAFGKEVEPGGGDVCDSTTGCQEGVEDGSAGSLENPSGVSFSPVDGDLYVSDDDNNRIDVFTPEGSFLRSFGKEVNPGGGDVCTAVTTCRPGEAGFGAGYVSDPFWSAIDASGNLWVSELDNERVAEFTSEGEFVKAVGSGVLDGEEAFQVCTTSTGCKKAHPYSGAALMSPYGLAVDCTGALVAVSEYFHAPEAAQVTRLGEAGGQQPPCASPPPPPAPKTSTSPPPPGPPSSKFSFGKLALNRKKGTATLDIKVPGPGSVKLAGEGVKQARATAKKAGQVKLAVKLSGKALKKLNEAGKATVKAKITFAPTGGAPSSKPRSLTLKKTLKS